ncbi:MAG: riboflavin synthase [Planctomycetota bacterium]|nr:riboflavin synthase [Planctomycetota bacterium]
MFTGIIQHAGAVQASRPRPGGRRLEIDLGPLAGPLAPGDSVAVSGVCLTVAAAGAVTGFDVIGQTLRRTTLGSLRAGATVNLELPVSPTGALDGHIVAGHVDGVAKVRRVRQDRQEHIVEFAATRELTDEMIARGSIAIDGVSLTLMDVSQECFSVALVPTTLAKTTLANLHVGSSVNVETDIIGKYIRKYLHNLAAGSGGLTMEKLKDAGFI